MARYYSQNMLENPSAETEDTSGWEEVEGVTVVEGGTWAGNFCFKFAEESYMEQPIELTSPQTPSYRISGRFLPERYRERHEVTALAFIEFILEYAHEEKDYYRLPARRDFQR